MNTQTTSKPQTAEQIAPDEKRDNLPAIAGPRLPYHPGLESRFGVDQTQWRALVEAIYPSAQSHEGVILALSYCKARGLDPFKRPVHVVPVWSSAAGRMIESVWPGINELRTTAFRTGQYAGCEPTVFGDEVEYTFQGRVKDGKEFKDVTVNIKTPAFAQITVYRMVGGQRCPFPGPRINYLSAYGKRGKADVPNEKWERGPAYMLEKVAEAAALRKAFPEELAGMQAAEEMEGQTIEGAPDAAQTTSAPPPPKPTRKPDEKREAETARKAAADMDGQYRATATKETVIDEDGVVQDQSPEPPPANQAPVANATTGTEKMLMQKLDDAKTIGLVNSIVIDYGAEIDGMNEQSPEAYDRIQKHIAARKAVVGKK